MASNSYQLPLDRAKPKKMAGVHELDAISPIHAQLALLMRKLDVTNVSVLQTQNFLYDSYPAGQSSNDGQVGNFVFS